MQTKLTWEKGLFSDSFCIFDSDKQIGFMKKSLFSQKSIAEINGEKYEFRENGLFKQETDIIDVSKNQVIGKIKYNTWGHKAFLDVHSENFTWEYKNIWNTEWVIYDSQGLNISYKSSLTSGQIETNANDAIKLLSGLYVYNYYYTQMMALVSITCSMATIITLSIV